MIIETLNKRQANINELKYPILSIGTFLHIDWTVGVQLGSNSSESKVSGKPELHKSVNVVDDSYSFFSVNETLGFLIKHFFKLVLSSSNSGQSSFVYFYLHTPFAFKGKVRLVVSNDIF